MLLLLEMLMVLASLDVKGTVISAMLSSVILFPKIFSYLLQVSQILEYIV